MKDNKQHTKEKQYWKAIMFAAKKHEWNVCDMSTSNNEPILDHNSGSQAIAFMSESNEIQEQNATIV